jgi:hypothetical protein
MKDLSHTVDPVSIGVESIVAAFIVNPKQNEHSRCHSESQSCDIDKRIDFASPDAPESDF